MDGSGGFARELITFDRAPESYRHWRLSVEGRVATLAMNVDEDAGLKPGYRLKLNSYDLGVDMELADAVQRIRFEHPQVGCVVVTSDQNRVFCSGANIYMLGLSSHAWKVNFCKFTNETRNGLEDSSRTGGPKFLAAVNGSCAGGGYELALACDEIVLVDDRSSAVSLPEVPLLAVLPGTGGLTRLTDKRGLRRDHSDLFCTLEEGVRGKRAKDWKLVDEVVAPGKFAEHVSMRAAALASETQRPESAEGVALTPLAREMTETGLKYRYVTAEVDAERRVCTLTVRAPDGAAPADGDAARALGVDFWPLAMARELDDAILLLRLNWPDIGLWVLETEGEAARVLEHDAFLQANTDHWFVRETLGQLRRTFARLEVSSRSLFAVVRPGSCFAGTLAELLITADRSYMLNVADGPTVTLSAMNFGPLPTVAGQTRLQGRFPGDRDHADSLVSRAGEALDTATCEAFGLITWAPDELDWDEEVRLAVDGRAALSPDALTGMEASLRFGGAETMWTKVFGRLSAWQNWIFIRPNAVGEGGALKLFGTGKRADFDWNRV